MLIIKNGKVVEITESENMFNLIPDRIIDNLDKAPYDIAALSTETLPAGMPIMTNIFIVDKIEVAFCDGNDNWYREADKPVAAGQPISALFESE